MKNNINKFNHILLASVICFSSLFTFYSCNSNVNMNSNDISTNVYIQELTKRDISKYINTYGSALPIKEASLKSEIQGNYILQINPRTHQQYKLGDKVYKDEVIVKLEDEAYVNQTGVEAKKLDLQLAKQEQIKEKALYEKGGVTLNELRQNEVKVMNAQTSYDNAIINLKKMSISTPISGIITDLPYFTQNVKIDQGQDIFSVMDYTHLLIECNLPESTINQIKTGQHVNITHYTIPNDTLKGVISEISPAISLETRTYKSKILINNSKLMLRPGMFIKADILVETHTSTIVIPKEIVMTQRNRKYVFIADKNQAKVRYIKTGLEDENYVEVLSGLKFGENIITKGYETLKDNSNIKVNR